MARTISIIGLGKLGLPFAVCWASRGFRVIGFDIRREALQQLSEGKLPGTEIPTEVLLPEARSRISVAENGEDAVLSSNVSFVIVATPSEEDGRFSTIYVERAMQSIGNALRKKTEFHLVVLVSTVLPGTCDKVVKPLLERVSGKTCGVDFGLCYNPEFIALGEVVRGLLRPDMVVIGQSDSRSGDILANIYKKFCENNPPTERMSLWNAELAKISLNVFITLKIAFANNLAALCESIPEGNVDVVSHTLGLDSRIGSKYLTGGLSYGGPCFPRDNRAYSHSARNLGVQHGLSEAVDEANKENNTRVARKIMEGIKEVINPQVALLGLTYKPNTKVVEESAAISIARNLIVRGIRVKGYDPMGMSEAQKVLGDQIQYSLSVEDCLTDSDLCAIATPWKEFRKLQPSLFLRKMRHPAILDCWRILNQAKFLKESRLTYSAIGISNLFPDPHDLSLLPLVKHGLVESPVI